MKKLLFTVAAAFLFAFALFNSSAQAQSSDAATADVTLNLFLPGTIFSPQSLEIDIIPGASQSEIAVDDEGGATVSTGDATVENSAEPRFVVTGNLNDTISLTYDINGGGDTGTVVFSSGSGEVTFRDFTGPTGDQITLDQGSRTAEFGLSFNIDVSPAADFDSTIQETEAGVIEVTANFP